MIDNYPTNAQPPAAERLDSLRAQLKRQKEHYAWLISFLERTIAETEEEVRGEEGIQSLGGLDWHVLKTHPPYFDQVLWGLKTFEVRVNDRDFKSGDILVLREYDPETGELTGRTLTRRVIYVLQGGVFDIPANMCVMSIIPI